jgi:predicted RNA-binding protein with PUA-like domain
MPNRYWLIKSEPDAYSIDDLKKDTRTYWDGVRNYQARNFMRDQMEPGDLVFFYHSNAEPPGIAGVAKVVKKGYPDPSAFDKKDIHYDDESNPKKPTWFVVDIEFVEKFPILVSLEDLKKVKGLEEMPLLKKGQRLSVQPVSEGEWKIIHQLVKNLSTQPSGRKQ